MRISIVCVALLGACTSSSSLNGKKLGGGGGGGSSSSSTSGSSSSGPSGASGSAAETAATTSKCDAEHDHCLEPDNWFALSFHADQGPDQPIDAYPAKWIQPSGDLPWLWGYRCDCTVGGYGVRTVPATRDDVAVERRVVVYLDVDGKNAALPRDERAARKDEWRAGVVASVDTNGGGFQMTGHKGRIPFASARVVVEYRERVPERPQTFPVPFKDPTP